VFLLTVLGAIWLIGREIRAAHRESYRALPPQTVCEIAVLAALGFWAALRGAVLSITLDQQSALRVVAYWLVAALALLAALYQIRQS